MKVLLIGGNSFVGSSFYKIYKKNIFLSSRNKDSQFYLEFSTINEDFFKQVGKEKITHCFFLAAISSPDECETEFKKANSTNVISTKKIISRLLEMSIKIIFFSSDQVYPDTNTTFSTDYPCIPKSKYGEMKKDIEDAFLYNTNFKIFRLSYIYDASDGFLKYIENCAKSGKEAEIYKDFARNIIHINDVIECMNVAVINWNEVKKISNICGPECLSRVEMTDVIKKKLYNSLKFKIVEASEKFWKARTKVCNLDPNDTKSILKRAPISFEKFLEGYHEN
tara:strand:- start:776 stop:1615 length:840 start_codon:yes stop_codon:yes gene_type:complete